MFNKKKNPTKLSEKEILKLKQENRTLKKLAEITRTINASLDIRKLLNAIMEAVKEILECEASSLLFYDEDTNELVFKVAIGAAGNKLTDKQRIKANEGIAGWVAAKNQPVIVNNVYADKRFNPHFDQVTGFQSRAIICAPLLFKGKRVGVIEGINPVGREKFTEGNLETLIAFADQAVMAVQNAMIFERAIDDRRIKQELDSARNFQKQNMDILDKKFEGFSIAAKSISAHEVGGEFYDFFNFNEKNFAITLGDIHEKGIPGALSASMINGAIKMLTQKKNTPPVAFVKKIGQFINNNITTFKEVSFFYSIFNAEKKTLDFANTGFAYPILIRKGIARYLRFNTHSYRADYEAGKVKYPKKVRVLLQEGDIFLIITDGILNLRNKQAQRYGLKRVMKISQSVKKDPAVLIKELLKDSDGFVEEMDKKEDITIICFRVGK